MQAELTRSKDNSPIRLVSTRFGDMTIPREYIWDFPEGLVGMRHIKRFALINTSDNRETIFMWLHSIEHSDFAIPVMDPMLVFNDYRIRQDESEILRLGIDEMEQVQVLVIVNVPPGNPGGITANLVAPLILQTGNKTGWQVILEKSNYRVAQPLFAEKAENQPDESEAFVSVSSSSPSISVVKSDYKDDTDSVIVNRVRIIDGGVLKSPDSVT